jgi:hypothetical protein
MFVVCSINLEEQCLAWGLFLKIEMLKLRPHIIRYIIDWMNFSSGFHCCFLPWFERQFYFSRLGFWYGLEDLIQGVWSSFPKGPDQIVQASDKDVYSLYGCENETLMKIFVVNFVLGDTCFRGLPLIWGLYQVAWGHKHKYYGSCRYKVMS